MTDLPSLPPGPSFNFAAHLIAINDQKVVAR